MQDLFQEAEAAPLPPLASSEPGPPALPSVAADAPLAARLRPARWEEILGQEHLLGAHGPLRPALDGGRLPSLVLVGPPGTGKTTIAQLLALAQSAHLVALSAVSSGVADVRRVVAEAKERQRLGQGTVLFLDEIHHFSRTQQDALLPHVETGLLTLIGATTENPSFQLTGALLSRVQVLDLRPLTADDLSLVLDRALGDRERGLGDRGLSLAAEARQLLIRHSGGDARLMLNALERAADGVDQAGEVQVADVQRALSSPHLLHDRAGDLHYQILSAFIKSLRGSDPDAAVYWLARLLEAGEDPLLPARRMVILAAEDIGLAQPSALQMAVAAHQATAAVGMPECRLPLAEAAIFLALAPKSNSSYRAYAQAAQDVERHRQIAVPLHLRNPVTNRDQAAGFGQGYQYAHDDPEGLVDHSHLPTELEGRIYYRPSSQGLEQQLAQRLNLIRERRARRQPGAAE
ncbi:MAG: replication-associated recombination protein A [Candidatus Dormibacteria bacterium]